MKEEKRNIKNKKEKGVVNLEELKEGRLYRVEWFDITSHVWKDAYKEKGLLDSCWTIGYVWRDKYEDKDVLIVIYGKSIEDSDECFDVIPLQCIKNIYEINPKEVVER